jgi:hypothetical protein
MYAILVMAKRKSIKERSLGYGSINEKAYCSNSKYHVL